MAERASDVASGRSILSAVEAAVPSLAQLIRQAEGGSSPSWLLDTERLTGLLAGSAIAFLEGEQMVNAVIPPRMHSTAVVKRLNGALTVRVSRDGALTGTQYVPLASLMGTITVILPAALFMGTAPPAVPPF